MISLNLIHPVVSGMAGFSSTIIGSFFFKGENQLLVIALGIVLFLLSNQFMLKFQFNSYQLNGATLTTILSFLTQAVCLTVYNANTITLKWGLGVLLILSGTVIISRSKEE